MGLFEWVIGTFGLISPEKEFNELTSEKNGLIKQLEELEIQYDEADRVKSQRGILGHSDTTYYLSKSRGKVIDKLLEIINKIKELTNKYPELKLNGEFQNTVDQLNNLKNKYKYSSFKEIVL